MSVFHHIHDIVTPIYLSQACSIVIMTSGSVTYIHATSTMTVGIGQMSLWRLDYVKVR